MQEAQLILAEVWIDDVVTDVAVDLSADASTLAAVVEEAQR